MNVRGIREVDFVFTSDKEILFVVPNSIKIRRRDGKLRLRKFFVRHCLTTKNLFSDGLLRAVKCAGEHVRRIRWHRQERSAVAAFFWEARCLTLLPRQGCAWQSEAATISATGALLPLRSPGC